MKFRILPFLLALLTVFVMGRIGLSLVQQEQPLILVQKIVVDPTLQEDDELAALPLSQAAAPATKSWLEDPALWKGSIIPTAAAAATMDLSEESERMPSSKDLEALRAAKKHLDEREKALKERKKSADEAVSRANERIAELEALEARIQDFLVQEKSINDKKIKRLTAVYEGMKAIKAAPVIAQMKLITVVKMFSKMNEKKVGKILSFLPPKQAVLISQALTKRIGSLPQ